MNDNFEKIGFIGLGSMGKHMAKNLLLNSFPLVVYDKDKSMLNEFEKLGAESVENPCHISEKVNLIFLCLPFAPQIEDVIFGEQGLIKGKYDNLMIVDTSTIYCDDAINFRKKLNEKRIIYCDCPVSGLPKKAKDGTLTMMFGGTEKEFFSVLPFLKTMGESIIHCGTVGNGQITKAFNNILYNINIAGLCEVLPLALKAGLNVNVLKDLFISGSSRSFASEYFLPKILKNDFNNDYDMKDAYKDIINVEKAIKDFEIHTPMTTAMKNIYNKTLEMNLEERPKSAMVKFFEKEFKIRVTKNE